jgi:hypothetical protein
MHSPIFEQAVKRYHQREQMDRSGTLSLDSAINNFDPDSPLELHIDTQVALSESEVRARQQLEALPTEILQHVQSFREHVDYFVRAGDVAGRGKSGWSGGRDGHVDGTASVPEGMKQLLDDITGPERIPGRIKDDIMQDADARRVSPDVL